MCSMKFKSQTTTFPTPLAGTVCASLSPHHFDTRYPPFCREERTAPGAMFPHFWPIDEARAGLHILNGCSQGHAARPYASRCRVSPRCPSSVCETEHMRKICGGAERRLSLSRRGTGSVLWWARRSRTVPHRRRMR